MHSSKTHTQPSTSPVKCLLGDSNNQHCEKAVVAMLAFNKALMVFERHHESQTLVIAINGSNQEATIRLNLPSPAQTLPLPHMHVSAPTENDVLHLSPWQVWVGELHSN
ncbi:alpha-glucosidase C-terminal domain-containing protein [Enterovibrio norvegicus]|uniref:hypothetical protein n=1 Tax=Enterovibrio norvegicus TaxID=188144 RepID=UPI003D136A25